jgi:hypothetical protein
MAQRRRVVKPTTRAEALVFAIQRARRRARLDGKPDRKVDAAAVARELGDDLTAKQLRLLALEIEEESRLLLGVHPKDHVRAAQKLASAFRDEAARRKREQ